MFPRLVTCKGFPDLTSVFEQCQLDPSTVTHVYISAGLKDYCHLAASWSAEVNVRYVLYPFFAGALKVFPRATITWLGLGYVPRNQVSFDLFEQIHIKALALSKKRDWDKRLLYRNIFRNFHDHFVFGPTCTPDAIGSYFISRRLISLINSRI